MTAKKKLLMLLGLLLVFPFYLTFTLINQSAGREGALLADEKQAFTVSVRDGAVSSGSHVIEVTLPADDTYNTYVTIDAKDAGFAIGYVIKSPSGKVLTALTSYGLTDLPCPISAETGKQTFEASFLGDRNAMADFAKTYWGYKDGAQLDQFLSQYDFDAPIKDGDFEVTFSLKVREIKPYSIGMQVICPVIGLVLFFTLFFALGTAPAKGDDKESTLGERMDGIGNCYAIFETALILTQVIVIFVLRNFAADFTAKHAVTLSLLLTILAVDVIGFSVAWLSSRKIPREVIPQKKLGVGKFLLFLLMEAGIVGAGTLLGMFVHNLVAGPAGANTSNLATLMMNSGMFMRVLAVGICAPIFEELIFRKLLVDRLVKHGEFIAIFTSGLFFGLYHGNFQQFFFTFGLGMLWAFVYVRTGRIRYTIGMHMAMNMATSIISVFLLGKCSENLALLESTDTASIMALLETNPEAFKYLLLLGLWIITLVLLAIIGFILFIVFMAQKKFRLKKTEGEVTKGKALGALFGNGFVWIFLLSVLGLFLNTYLPYYLQ